MIRIVPSITSAISVIPGIIMIICQSFGKEKSSITSVSNNKLCKHLTHLWMMDNTMNM